MQRRDKVYLSLSAVLLLLLALRIALPYGVERYVNNQLQGLESYSGHVDEIDLALWRGAYRIHGLTIVKRGTRQSLPFFSSERVDLSVEWRSLVQGSLVSEVVFHQPVLNLAQATSDAQSQLGKGEAWQTQLEGLFPFQFNTIEVRNAKVTFTAPGIQTRDALTAEHVNGTLTNLTNVIDANADAFAHFSLNANVLGNAPAKVQGSLDPWAKRPTFDVNLEVKSVSLPNVNPWLRQFIKADAEAGDFELYLEIAAADGRFKGYAKPILRNVDITSSEEEGNVLQKVWEGVVEFAANVFENHQQEQVAARIPFTGTIDDPKASVWPTIVSVVRNAFVGALLARSKEVFHCGV